MAGNAEAISSIRTLVEEQGHQVRLDEVLMYNDSPRPAGISFDKEEPIKVEGLSDRILFPDGVMSGLFAVRAVIVDPRVSDKFTGEDAGEDGITMVRARLTYDIPPTNFCVGGSASNTSAYVLREGDGTAIDTYYAACRKYSEALRFHQDELDERFGGSWNSSTDLPFESKDPGEVPEMEYIMTRYILDLPEPADLPDDDRYNMRILGRSKRALDSLSSLIATIQAAYPETTILSSRSYGGIVQDELPLLAEWLSAK